jgi:outer membrane lipoprotein-sorting protein
MKKYIIIIVAVLNSIPALCQKTPKGIKITYEKKSNGTVVENQDFVVFYATEKIGWLTTEKRITEKLPTPFEENFIDFQNNKWYQKATLKPLEEILTVDSTSIAKQNFELLPETKTILGYQCQKAKIIVNSNTIELWYTKELSYKGGPSILGQNLGLVLELNRNGNYQIQAKKIDQLKKMPLEMEVPQHNKKSVDLLTYKDLLWKSRFTTLPVFKNEIIHFSEESKSNDSILRFANGTIIVKKVRFPEIKNGSQLFVDVTEQSNGDAYDRTGSVFIIPTSSTISFLDGLQKGVNELPIFENGNGKKYQGVVKTTDYEPLIELMRFFTPFGVKKYNTIQLKNKVWQDSVYYRQDLSELSATISNKEIYIGMNIGNYDKGGHKVSLNFTIHPEDLPKKELTSIPLFNTNNVMEMAGQEYGTMFNSEKGLTVSFNLLKPMKNARLRYITTGHGGWENGDEFIPKKNSVSLDGTEVFSFIPWRQDCGSYRLSNPASGNFENGLSSSDYSRSNWCPGTVTNPIFIELGAIQQGEHTLQIQIPQGANEGTSFSSWNVSGVLIGE